MIRIAFIGIYLAAGATAVLLFNANIGAGEVAIAIWAISSVLLGWGTGQMAFAVLALLPIVFAVPFDIPDNYEFSEPLPIWWGVAFLAPFSAVLILIGAVARLIAEKKKAPPERGFR